MISATRWRPWARLLAWLVSQLFWGFKWAWILGVWKEAEIVPTEIPSFLDGEMRRFSQHAGQPVSWDPDLAQKLQVVSRSIGGLELVFG